MDNNPLIYILPSAKSDALGYHQIANLANDNSTLKYQSGKMNVDTNAPFHIPRGSMISI